MIFAVYALILLISVVAAGIALQRRGHAKRMEQRRVARIRNRLAEKEKEDKDP